MRDCTQGRALLVAPTRRAALGQLLAVLFELKQRGWTTAAMVRHNQNGPINAHTSLAVLQRCRTSVRLWHAVQRIASTSASGQSTRPNTLPRSDTPTIEVQCSIKRR